MIKFYFLICFCVGFVMYESKVVCFGVLAVVVRGLQFIDALTVIGGGAFIMFEQ